MELNPGFQELEYLVTLTGEEGGGLTRFLRQKRQKPAILVYLDECEPDGSDWPATKVGIVRTIPCADGYAGKTGTSYQPSLCDPRYDISNFR